MPLTRFFGGPVGGQEYEVAGPTKDRVIVESVLEKNGEVMWFVSIYRKTSTKGNLETFHLHDVQAARRRIELKDSISLLQ